MVSFFDAILSFRDGIFAEASVLDMWLAVSGNDEAVEARWRDD